MLTLTDYKENDAKKLITWTGDSQEFYRWSFGRLGNYPITAERINNSFINDDSIHLIALDSETPVGHIMLKIIEEKPKTIRFGLIIVDSTKRGKGYGRELLKVAIEYAKRQLKAEKITIGVFENNTPAFNLYTSLGFNDMGKATIYNIENNKWACKELQLIIKN